jgi:hypothetical protein
MKTPSYTPLHLLFRFSALCLFPFGFLSVASANDTVIQIEQKINEALDAAANDPVAIEAALQSILAEARPTAAGMKVIASAALRKVASYNKQELVSAVSEGMVRAAMTQATQSGVDPIQAAASVSEGLISSAMGTASRRGGNSIVTGSNVAKSTLTAVVQTANKLKISVLNAANAASFGAIKAAVATSADYGHDLVSTTFNVTSGITEGAVSAAIHSGLDSSGVAEAVKTGAIDGVHVQAQQEKLQNLQMVRGAVLGFERGLGLALGRNVNALPTEDDVNRDILGTISPPKTVPVRNLDTGKIEVRLKTTRPLGDGFEYQLIKNGQAVGSPQDSSVFEIGEQPTESNIGLYAIQVINKADPSQTLSSQPTSFSFSVPQQAIVISPSN